MIRITRVALAVLAAVSLVGFVHAPRATEVPGEGLWYSKKRFGPDARGTLTVRRDGTAWLAEIAGYRVPFHVRSDTIAFDLPDSLGWFRGRMEKGGNRISGHWTQWGGNRFASPLTLERRGAQRWTGEVVPVEDGYTMFLRLTKRADGTLAAFLRNPERNLGYQLRAEYLEVRGNQVRLMGKRNGNGEVRPLAWGVAGEDDFNLYFPGRGGSYDFRPVGRSEYSDFYPRGKQPERYAYQPPPDMGDGWPVGTLESVGLDRAGISAFVSHLINQSMDSLSAQQMHALLIARHGKLVLEEYFHGDHRELAHDTRSAAKSFTSTLAGAVIRSGALSVKSPVYDIMYDGRAPANLEPRKRTITLGNFMNMASGIDCDDRDDKSPGSENHITDDEPDPDYYRYALTLKTIRDPGTVAVYCSIQAHFVGGVLSKATGRPLTDLFQEMVAKPLDFGRYYMGLAPTGVGYMGGGLRVTARDFMKFGQLYLNGGTWRGRRILDASFVREATAPTLPLEGQRYGYFWWITRYPYRGDTLSAYYAGGNGGQVVIVVPKLDLVITTNGGSYNDRVLFKFQREDVPGSILPAVGP